MISKTDNDWVYIISSAWFVIFTMLGVIIPILVFLMMKEKVDGNN